MNSLRQDILRKRSTPEQLTNLDKRIKAKHERLQRVYGIEYDRTVLGIAHQPAILSDAVVEQSILRFCRRDIDIWLDLCAEENLIFSAVDNKWIPASRKPFTIAFHNPIENKTQSWSRLSSDSKKRFDHHPSGGGARKSKFLRGLPTIKKLEFLTFNQGVGVLESPSKLRMYMKFVKPVGKSSDGKLLSIICVQCDRVFRTTLIKGTKPGYKVNLHGYPISKSDLEKAFGGMKISHSDVPEIAN